MPTTPRRDSDRHPELRDGAAPNGRPSQGRPHRRRSVVAAQVLGSLVLVASLAFAQRPPPPGAPGAPVIPKGPQIEACTQLVMDGKAVRITMVATATGPTTVQLSWQGYPGEYVISGAMAATVQVVESRLLKTPRGSAPLPPQLESATIAHYGAQPDFKSTYTVSAKLTDGRIGCGATSVKTPPFPQVTPPAVLPKNPRPPPPLAGWVDLHTHPMSNLAFGGLIFHGGPDVGAVLPRDAACKKTIATSRDHALGPVGTCGDVINGAVSALAGAGFPGARVAGSPDFLTWPSWDDKWNQKMWFEWIARARDGGLRVMVALAHNNSTLAKARGGPLPKNDKDSGDLQIDEIKRFVANHPTLMELAKSAADIPRIAKSDRIAVVLGVELDRIGDFPTTPGATTLTQIGDEIDRLYRKDVRYIFPVHLTDNAFGGSAVYSPMFNAANFDQAGSLYKIECAPCGDEIGFKMPISGQTLNLGFVQIPVPLPPPICNGPQAASCPQTGHRNQVGMNPFGEFAVRKMMQLGMLVDIDHMSQQTAERALWIAETLVSHGGYPLLSGHSAVREQNVPGASSEAARSVAQLKRIGKLGGMFGLGTDGTDAFDWARRYMVATTAMGASRPGSVAFGTDMNSLVAAPKPPAASGRTWTVGYSSANPASTTGTRTWDYQKEGVAHYGMMKDFVQDVRTAPSSATKSIPGTQLVDDNLARSADYFWHMWERCEAQKAYVP